MRFTLAAFWPVLPAITGMVLTGVCAVFIVWYFRRMQ